MNPASLKPLGPLTLLAKSSRRLLWTTALAVILLAVVTVAVLSRGHFYLEARVALVSPGMTRAQVEGILGPAAVSLNRTDGRGTLLAWADQLWQVDISTDTDGLVESVSCGPSNSVLRRTVGRIIPLPKATRRRVKPQ